MKLIKRIPAVLVMALCLFGLTAVAASAHENTTVDIGALCDESTGHLIGDVTIIGNEHPTNSTELPMQHWRIEVSGQSPVEGFFPQGGGITSQSFDLGLAPVRETGVTVTLWFTNTHHVPWQSTPDVRNFVIDGDFDCTPVEVTTTTTPATTTTKLPATTTPQSTTTSTIPAVVSQNPPTTIKASVPDTSACVERDSVGGQIHNCRELALTGNNTILMSIIGLTLLLAGIVCLKLRAVRFGEH